MNKKVLYVLSTEVSSNTIKKFHKILNKLLFGKTLTRNNAHIFVNIIVEVTRIKGIKYKDSTV